MHWYPLKLSAHVRAYAFGGRLIPERVGKTGLPEGTVAETWEVSDYRDTSGTVTNGSLGGTSLHDLVLQYPDELVGSDWQGPHFPLLEKFLDASHALPVHLHADDETARRVYSEPNGKTEAWHILWAAQGASILAGVKPELSREALFRSFKAQDYDAVMYRYPIQAGDTVYVPGGVLHSFGPDTLIFEVQQTSDLTQTVMPADLYGQTYAEEQWDHNIRATLDELRTDFLPRPNPGLPRVVNGNHYVVGCASAHFALERWRISGEHREPSHPDRFLTLANVGNPVQLDFADGTDTLARGESCLLPAALGELRVTPRDGKADLIACYVPDLQRDVVRPLRAAGYSDREIQSLGEVAM